MPKVIIRITAPYTGWTFLHIHICCKFVLCVWKDENKWKRGRCWPIFLKKQVYFFYIWYFFIFLYSNTNFTEINVDVSGIRTRIVGIEGEHADQWPHYYFEIKSDYRFENMKMNFWFSKSGKPLLSFRHPSKHEKRREWESATGWGRIKFLRTFLPVCSSCQQCDQIWTNFPILSRCLNSLQKFECLFSIWQKFWTYYCKGLMLCDCCKHPNIWK